MDSTAVPRLKGVDHGYKDFLVAAFVGGFVVIWAYVLCERAPCHASPWHEKRFLGIVGYILIVVCSVSYYGVYEDLEKFERVENTCMMCVYMMQFFLNAIPPARLKPYGGPQPEIRSKAAEDLAQAIVSELELTPFVLFPTLSSDTTPPLIRAMLPLFMLVLIAKLTLHPDGISLVVTSFFAYLGIFLIILTWFLQVTRYVFKTRATTKLLVSLLRQMEREGLAKEVLPMLHCPFLFQYIGDTGIIGSICASCSPQLDAVGKAVLIDALAKNGLGWAMFPRSWRRQRIILSLFHCTRGYELTQLKNCLDMGNDVYNLVYLYNHMSRDMQRRLVETITANMEILHGADQLKVVSDIDDTLYSSGGHFPAGCDRRWPKKSLYPGVLALYRSLDRFDATRNCMNSCEVLIMPNTAGAGYMSSRMSMSQSMAAFSKASSQYPSSGINIACPSGQGLKVSDFVQSSHVADDEYETEAKPILARLHAVDECNLVFLSARPHVHKDVAEAASYRLFTNLVRARRLHTTPSLIPGSLWSGLQAVVGATCTQKAWTGAGMQKVKSFFTYARLYPEYSFVFIGDNGQGDVLAAEKIMAANVGVKACFIHEVLPLHKTLTSLPVRERSEWENRGIFFFSSHVGAAVDAERIGLIGLAELSQVMAEAVDDASRTVGKAEVKMRATPTEKNQRNIQRCSNYIEQLVADMDCANAVLASNGMPEVAMDELLVPSWHSGGQPLPELPEDDVVSCNDIDLIEGDDSRACSKVVSPIQIVVTTPGGGELKEEPLPLKEEPLPVAPGDDPIVKPFPAPSESNAVDVLPLPVRCKLPDRIYQSSFPSTPVANRYGRGAPV